MNIEKEIHALHARIDALELEVQNLRMAEAARRPAYTPLLPGWQPGGDPPADLADRWIITC